MNREKLESLDEALTFARDQADRVRRTDRPDTVKAFRDYAPGQQVAARIEISGKGFLRGPEAGIDVLGDGAIVAYTGAITKRPVEADSLDDAIDRLRASLLR